MDSSLFCPRGLDLGTCACRNGWDHCYGGFSYIFGGIFRVPKICESSVLEDNVKLFFKQCAPIYTLRFIYLKGRVTLRGTHTLAHTQRNRENEREFLSTGSLPGWLLQAELGEVKAKSLELHVGHPHPSSVSATFPGALAWSWLGSVAAVSQPPYEMPAL